MIDVRLITLIPPAPPVAQPASAQAVTTQGATVTPQLANGSILSGFIINRDAGGNPILRTDNGDVLFASNLFLKIGSEVVIRIHQSGGQQSAHIVTVNGLPPETVDLLPGFEGDIETIAGKQQSASQQTAGNASAQSAAIARVPSALTPGHTISAIVITPAFTPPGAAPAAPPLPPGTSLLLSVLNHSPEQTTAAPQSPLAQITATAPPAAPPNALSSLLPGTPAPQAQSPQAQAAQTVTTVTNAPAQPQTAQPPAPVNPPQSALASLLPQTATAPAPQAPAAQMPAAPPAQPTAAAPLPTQAAPLPANQSAPITFSNQQAADAKFTGPLGQTLVATVVAQSDDGSVTLTSPLGTLRAASTGPLPQGQQVALRVSSVTTPNNYTLAIAQNAAPAPLAPLTELSRTWASLQQIVQLLGEKQAAQIIPNFSATPAAASANTPPAQAGNQMLFFISALKGGNFKDWLGSQNVKSLEEKGYAPLLRKAEGEFMQIARQFAEPAPGNWQSAFFPVIASGELQQVRAFIKREKKKSEDGTQSKAEDTRFVLEMELSQLGEMQMDGLVKRKENSLQFDLVIRSMDPLPKTLERDIQAIYSSTAELTGYRGQLAFQVVHTFPVHPLEDTTPHVFDDVVV